MGNISVNMALVKPIFFSLIRSLYANIFDESDWENVFDPVNVYSLVLPIS